MTNDDLVEQSNMLLQDDATKAAWRLEQHEQAVKLGRFGDDIEVTTWTPLTEVWAHTLTKFGDPTGYSARRRGRRFGEIAKDLQRIFSALKIYEMHGTDSAANRVQWRSVGLPDLLGIGAGFMQPPENAEVVADYPFDGEGLSVCNWTEYGGKAGGAIEWPDNVRFTQCYAVTGGSEGHYARVDLVLADHKPKLLQVFSCKTFDGLANAQKIANKLGELLGA